MDYRTEQMAAQLHSVSMRMLRVLRREDEEAGMSASRLSALSVIVFAGPISLADLSEAEHVRAPTMSRIVENLVQDGLVTREADLKDRRMVSIAATPAGRALLDEGRARRVQAISGRLGKLADSERRALYRGIELMERITRI
jgi:DNA-binding MarR family transcriptional regulator